MSLARDRVGALVATTLLGLMAGVGHAAPPGREWTPVQRLVHADHDWMHTHRFEPTAGGRLELLLSGRGGARHNRTYGLVWRDSTWQERWRFDSRYDLQHIWPCLNDSGVQMLVYATQPPGAGPGPFYMAFVEGDTVTTPDSIATKFNFNILTVGTQSRSMRWAAGVDEDPLGRGDMIRIFAKSRAAVEGTPWTELRVPPEMRQTVTSSMTLQAHSDSSCLVIWSDSSNDSPGLSWGIVNDTGWVRSPELIQRFLVADRPVTKRLESGDYMAMYGNNDSVSVLRTLSNETWSDITALRWSFPTDQAVDQYFMYSSDMSLDNRPLPVLTAVSYNSRNGRQTAHVSVPDSGRYARGEWLLDSAGSGLPFVARDENGDVWLAWSQFYDGAFWLHSHVTSTCDAPVLSEAGGAPRVSWALSARTPESAWRVLRSVDEGPYEPLERVIAGEETNLAWVDTTAPASARLRYRIRRESRDVRYVWESEPSAEWLPRARVLGLRLASPNPTSTELRAEITGASAGALEVRLLDLQGRTVAMQRLPASGLGRDAVSLSLDQGERLRPGLYLLRVRTSEGAKSTAIKVAIVR